MSASPSLDTYDLTKLAKQVLADDISLFLDMDIYDVDLFALCTPSNLIENRIRLSLVKNVGKSNIIWTTGVLNFENVDVFSFTTQGSIGHRELHKFILNEKMYIEMLQHLGTYYSQEDQETLPDVDEHFVFQAEMYI